MDTKYTKNVTKSNVIEEVNFLTDKFANLFFLSREYIYYYSSIKRVSTKRNVSEELSHNLNSIFRFATFKDCQDRMNYLINNYGFNSKTSVTDSNINIKAKEINPKGYNLLCIKDSMTFEYLKKQYYKAAKKYHPDKGGSNELMKIINDSYNLFHELLIGNNYKCDEDKDDAAFRDYIVIENSLDYFYLIGMFLVDVYTDIMAVDKAYNILNEIEMFGLDNKSDTRRKIFLSKVEVLRKLTKRLYLTDLKIESEYTFNKFKEVCILGNNERAIESVEEFIKKPSMRVINLRHPIQVGNSYRLRIIDEIKFHKLMKKFHKLKKNKNLAENSLKEYASKYGFIEDLGIYPTNKISQKPGNLVPEPWYNQIRYDHLKESQKVEYLNAFSKNIKFDLIKKYLWVRINSFFVAMIKSFSNLDHHAVIHECKFLESVFSKDKVPFYLVYKLYDYLESMNKSERKTRLQILNRIDTSEIINQFELKLNLGLPTYYVKAIELSDSYFQFAKSPLTILESIEKR